MQEKTNVLAQGATSDQTAVRFTDAGWEKTPVNVPAEMEFKVYVNHLELVTMQCTPVKLNCLVVGFLYSQGIISSMKDIASMRICEDDALADVMLTNTEFKLPTARTLTSGCGGGASFVTGGQKVESDLEVQPEDILSLEKQLQDRMELYRVSGGVHGSALASPKRLLVVAEDIGRHNTLDKIQGECLLRGLKTKDNLLLSTGRISSEMLLKAAKMQVPVVVSRTSPTERSIVLGRDLGIAVIGYVRAGHFTVYSHPERLGRPAENTLNG